MPKCKVCKKACAPSGVVTLCSYECAHALSMKADASVKAKKVRAAKDYARDYKRETKARKEKAKTRAEWYKDLQKEVNYYAKHILYRGHPCYTCGKLQQHTDSAQAFHAGHYRSVGACSSLRFEPRNLRIQCFSCNCANSGARKEYRDAIYLECGSAELEWLDGNSHEDLKEQFPTIDDIRVEIARYRKLIKDHKDNNQ